MPHTYAVTNHSKGMIIVVKGSPSNVHAAATAFQAVTGDKEWGPSDVLLVSPYTPHKANINKRFSIYEVDTQ